MTRWSFALVLTLTACGGGEESSEPDILPRTAPQDDCDTLMVTFCESSLACLEPEDVLSADELEHERALCIDVAKRTCDGVLVVNEGRYDDCFADVETLGAADCDAVRTAVQDGTDVSMPESCDAVFTQ
jgi:hypothetical protein